VGKRDHKTTNKFIKVLYKKLRNNGRIQLTSDGFKPYIPAIEDAFGADVDYTQLIKVFGSEYTEPGRYSPPELLEAIFQVISGNPDKENASTSYIERQNLTMRMQIRRLTRLTNAFSKKLDNLKAALSLHFCHYNFIRIHQTLKVTPAMEAGITDHVWEWDELIF